jgi:hypothetical protein
MFNPVIVPVYPAGLVRSKVPLVPAKVTPAEVAASSSRIVPAVFAMLSATVLGTDPCRSRLWPPAAVMVPVPEMVVAAATVPNIVNLPPPASTMLPPVVFSAALIVRLPEALLTSSV